MSSEFHRDGDGREFTVVEERFTPLVELLQDPRFDLDPTTRAHYESLIAIAGNENVFIRELIPDDLKTAPVTEIVIGKPPETKS